MGPLAGIKVLDLSRALAGAWASGRVVVWQILRPLAAGAIAAV